MRKNAWIELDCGGLRDNLQALRVRLKGTAEIMLVVKANAYGHGMKEVARCAQEGGVRWFVVSRMDEAMTLRPVVPDARILLMGSVWPSDLPDVLAGGITPALVSETQARALAVEARTRCACLKCHIKVDTGMGRFGFAWQETAQALASLAVEGGLAFEGLCTHFASAGKTTDRFADTQVDRFFSVVAECKARHLDIPFRHIANSAAFTAREAWHLDGVRFGILAYGYGRRGDPAGLAIKPFLQWKTRVVQVKRVPAGFPVSYLSTHVTTGPTQLATIDVGYSDGYSRLLSNKGYALVGGRRVKVVGRVTMNFTILDVGPDAAVKEGDEVVLLGQQGDESLWADELARWCQTIPYEILTNIRSGPLA